MDRPLAELSFNELQSSSPTPGEGTILGWPPCAEPNSISPDTEVFPFGYNGESHIFNANYRRSLRKRNTRKWRNSSRNSRSSRQHRIQTRRSRDIFIQAVREGLELAHSDVPLPGESRSNSSSDSGGEDSYCPTPTFTNRHTSLSPPSTRHSRPPSLDKQDAFCDEQTRKRRQSSDDTTSSQSDSVAYEPESMSGLDDKDKRDIVELYRFDLLYRNEYERGEDFSLDYIAKEDPVYSVKVVQARPRGKDADTGKPEPACPYRLTLDLDSTPFTKEEEFKAWLDPWYLTGPLSDKKHRRIYNRERWRQEMAEKGDVFVTEPLSRFSQTPTKPITKVIYELADETMEKVVESLDSSATNDFSLCDNIHYTNQLDDDLATEDAVLIDKEDEMKEDPTIDDTSNHWVVLGPDGS
jgi:hypothetical protein